MTKINLFWPKWARVVEPMSFQEVRARGLRCWQTVQRAAVLVVDAFDRRRRARLCRSVFLVLALMLAASPVSAEGGKKEQKANRTMTRADLEIDQAREPSKLYRALGLAGYGVSAGDVLSTEYTIARGGFESNRLVQNRGVLISSHVAVPVFINWTSEEFRKAGHGKVALWMRIGFVAYWGYLTAHNLRVGAGL